MNAVAAPAPVPLRWRVHGLELAGLSWGEPGGAPVLALHGWLDNAASFARLAPLLPGCHVVAPDLTGHGRSAHRSPDATYQIWDDLPELLGVMTALGWDSCHLLGHSRGAIIATLLASAYPERVRRLVLLDAVAPDAVAPADCPQQLRRSLDDKQRLLGRANRVYASTGQAITARERHGVSAHAAQLLAERNLRSCDGGVTWTLDPRLQGASAVKLSGEQIDAVLRSLRCPALLLVAAESGEENGTVALARRCIADIDIDAVPGGHHFHLEEQVELAARRITQFFSAHVSGIDGGELA